MVQICVEVREGPADEARCPKCGAGGALGARMQTVGRLVAVISQRGGSTSVKPDKGSETIGLVGGEGRCNRGKEATIFRGTNSLDDVGAGGARIGVI